MFNYRRSNWATPSRFICIRADNKWRRVIYMGNSVNERSRLYMILAKFVMPHQCCGLLRRAPQFPGILSWAVLMDNANKERKSTNDNAHSAFVRGIVSGIRYALHFLSPSHIDLNLQSRSLSAEVFSTMVFSQSTNGTQTKFSRRISVFSNIKMPLGQSVLLWIFN